MSSSPEPEKSFMEQYSSLQSKDCIRGQSPPELETRCLQICQSFIGGSWLNVQNTLDIEVNRITGGLTNQMYCVKLKRSVKRIFNEIYPNEPDIVAIKLFQKKLINPNGQESAESERLNDKIILTILSKTGIGPKVFGFFEDGFVQAYHEHSIFRPVHQQNPQLFAKVAQLLARTHTLNVPITKTNKWLIEMIQDSFKNAYDVDQITDWAEKLNLVHLSKRDLRVEFQDLIAWMADVKATAFCHNDFRRGNILVVSDSESGEKTIKLVDFEYCSYGFRGFDFACFLLEWGREKFDSKEIHMPDDSIIYRFIGHYVEACDNIVPGYSKRPGNSVDQIVLETKKCMLFNFHFLMSFILQQKESFIKGMPFDIKTNLKFIDSMCKTYDTIKAELAAQGII